MPRKIYVRLVAILWLALTLVGCRQIASQNEKAASKLPQAEQVAAVLTSTITLQPTQASPTIDPTIAAPAVKLEAVPLTLPKPANSLTEGQYGWSQLLARDAITPIYEPEFAPADEAPYSDDELVIGVAIDGEAKAYAIGPLNSREMVNDTLAGRPILVTW